MHILFVFFSAVSVHSARSVKKKTKKDARAQKCCLAHLRFFLIVFYIVFSFRIRDENLAKRGIDPEDTDSQIKAIEERGKTLLANYKDEMKQKLESWTADCKDDGELITVYKSGMHNSREEGLKAIEPALPSFKQLEGSFGERID